MIISTLCMLSSVKLGLFHISMQYKIIFVVEFEQVASLIKSIFPTQ